MMYMTVFELHCACLYQDPEGKFYDVLLHVLSSPMPAVLRWSRSP